MAKPERLQKYMARCGACSRRAAEEMILAGRVKVNKTVIIVIFGGNVVKY